MAGPVWVTAVEHVLAHLAKADVQALRLTARVFRSHPAVLALCFAASIPPQQHQAGLCFLQQLPKLQKLDLQTARSLFGVHQLSQLHRLEITGCQQVLDFYGMGQTMPQLRELSVTKCPAASLGNLSALSQLTKLEINQPGFHSHVAALTALKLLRIWPTPGVLDANISSCASLTGLTSLVDNACSGAHWHKLPQLVYLEINTPMGPQELAAIPGLTQLRGLALTLEEAVHLTALTPLTALNLERLELDRPLTVPALPALTRLTINIDQEQQVFPDMAALPKLSQIYVSSWGSLDLPDLPIEDYPQLSSIRYNDDEGRFTINARDHSRYSLAYVQIFPWIDEDT